MINWLITIGTEMLAGNFSFLILIVGIAQLIVMSAKKNNKKIKNKKRFQMKVKDLIGYYYPAHFEEQIVIRYNKRDEHLVTIDAILDTKCANDFVKYFWVDDNKLYIQVELNMEEGE